MWATSKDCYSVQTLFRSAQFICGIDLIEFDENNDVFKETYKLFETLEEQSCLRKQFEQLCPLQINVASYFLATLAFDNKSICLYPKYSSFTPINSWMRRVRVSWTIDDTRSTFYGAMK